MWYIVRKDNHTEYDTTLCSNSIVAEKTRKSRKSQLTAISMPFIWFTGVRVTVYDYTYKLNRQRL